MTSICFECRVLACTQASIYTTTEWANQRKSISVFHINLFIGPGSLNRQLVYWVAQGGIVHQEPFDPFPHFSDICEKCFNHLGELPRAPGPRPGKGLSKISADADGGPGSCVFTQIQRTTSSWRKVTG